MVPGDEALVAAYFELPDEEQDVNRMSPWLLRIELDRWAGCACKLCVLFLWGVGVCVWGVGLCGVGGGRNEEGRGASRCGATLCALKCIVLNSYMCVCLFVYVGVVWFVCPRCARQPVAHTISFCAPGYRELIEVQWIQLYKS